MKTLFCCLKGDSESEFRTVHTSALQETSQAAASVLLGAHWRWRGPFGTTGCSLSAMCGKLDTATFT